MIESKLQADDKKTSLVISNTNLIIWSIDKNFRITGFNNLFFKTLKDLWNIDFRIAEEANRNLGKVLPSRLFCSWKNLYQLVIKGEVVYFDFEFEKKYYTTSLYPILGNNEVVGASIYVRDITYLQNQNGDIAEKLVEANKDIGKLKHMSVSSVMNPHFLYNALNSIQYFILDNDRANAIKYLSIFSKFIRSILNTSSRNKISLAEELEQLHYYISLEQVRFEDKLDFMLKIDPEIQVERVQIPSLIIQPFVENAIIHGICNKEGKGILRLSISKTNGGILFEIEDDGIGRKAAMKFKLRNLQGHSLSKESKESKADSSLKLINTLSGVSYEVIDLFQDGIPSGTKVQILIR